MNLGGRRRISVWGGTTALRARRSDPGHERVDVREGDVGVAVAVGVEPRARRVGPGRLAGQSRDERVDVDEGHTAVAVRVAVAKRGGWRHRPELDVVDVPTGVCEGAGADLVAPANVHGGLVVSRGGEIVLLERPRAVRGRGGPVRPDRCPTRSVVGGNKYTIAFSPSEEIRA